MNKIVIVCHSTIASGYKNAIKMIAGINDESMITAIDFFENDSLEDLTSKINSCITNKFDNYYILTDLKGGSPFNAAFLYKQKNKEFNITIISGIHLALLLDLYIKINDLTNNDIQNIVNDSKNMIVII